MDHRASLLRETKELLRRYGIRPRKRLSQNFLVSRRALKLIIDALAPEPGDKTYEVGAGLGTLAHELLRRGAYVVAIEVDKRLIEVLRDRFRGGGVDVLCSDALSLPVPKVDKVVSNVPYGISSKLLLKLLREPNYRTAVLTLQREFALRLVARPGTAQYGRMSVIAQLYGEVEVIGSVSRRAFYPQPEVDSLVIRLRPRRGYREFFKNVEKLTAVIFSQRRRKLAKVMRRAGLYSSSLERMVDLGKRVYELTPREVLSLAVALEDVGS